jgi:hypothetical protein
MNIKTTKKHTVTVQATDLKKNLCSAFVDMLSDELKDIATDFQYFKMDLDKLHDELDSIEKNGFTNSFRDGYTMMLLGKEFDFIDEWFNRPKFKDEEELVVRIVNHLGDEIEVVKHEDLSY